MHLTAQYGDRFALPEHLSELPPWLEIPLGRYLQFRQSKWPAKIVQRSTRQLFNRLAHIFNYFLQHHDWTGWDQLSMQWVEDFIGERRRKGISPVTVNWDLSALRVFCQFLIDAGYPIPTQILKSRRLIQPYRLPRPLTDDQVRRLELVIRKTIDVSRDHDRRVRALRDLTWFYLLWHSGLRVSEVCSLALQDLDLNGMRVLIRNSKNRKDRLVFLSDPTSTAIQQFLSLRSSTSLRYLFPSKDGALTTRTIQRRLRRYGSRCGVLVSPRILRHTFASNMLGAGVPITTIQQFLGHKNLNTTMIYAAVADPVLKNDYYRGIETFTAARLPAR